MKQCPQCLRSYDDSQSFCLVDGAVLVVEDEQKTIVRPQPSAPKRSKTPLLLGIIVILLLAVVGLTAALFLYKSGGQSETAQSNRQQNSATQTSPGSSTPKAAPTANTSNNTSNNSSAANSSPAPNSSPVTNTSPKPEGKKTDDESEEITPISWGTIGMDFKNDPGMTYKFQCPPNGIQGVVIGSDIYMATSSICTAAVHAGVITLKKGGTVTVEFRPGRSVYGSTERNGVKSSTFGEYSHSYVIR